MILLPIIGAITIGHFVVHHLLNAKLNAIHEDVKKLKR
jgi:hypothetical protein